jgi:hypothetical protein
MGTREGIFNLRAVCDKYIQHNIPLYICFIDYEKAFDKVFHTEIIDSYKRLGSDGKNINIIQHLYWNQQAAIRTTDGISDKIPIKRGVRQGCVMSSKLFNNYTEPIFKTIEDLPGCKIGGRNYNNFRYADDTALVADSPEKLQNILDKVDEISEQYGLKINIKKTKIMVVSRDTDKEFDIKVQNQKLEKVEEFIYLGHLITSDGKYEREIKRRIAIAKSNFEKMSSILTTRNIKLQIRKRLLQCYVMSTFLYASETWSLNKDMEKRIEAMEVWFYRRMLKISYKDRTTNEEVFTRIGENKTLLNNIKKRKLQYFGHITRAEGLQLNLLEGNLEAKRSRGRPRLTWIDDIKRWTNKTYAEAKRIAQHRDNWRTMIVNLLREEDT